MVKKIFGILFFVGALLILFGSIPTLLASVSQGISPFTLGQIIGSLIPVGLYIWSGIFLITFDLDTKMNPITGFQTRSRKYPVFIVLISVYTALCVLTLLVGSQAATIDFLETFLNLMLMELPYAIPLIIFAIFLQMYAMPNRASGRYFLSTQAALQEYLGEGEVFEPITEDGFVHASQKALYFPSVHCVVPFDQIASVKLVKQLWEKDVYFYPVNGKKFFVVTKHFDTISNAVNNSRQDQP